MVGPTEALPGAKEALRGRPGRPGVDVRRGPGSPDDGRKTSWQLALRAWEDSGVTWDVPPAQVTPGQLVPGQLVPDRLVPDRLVPDQVAPDQVAPGRATPQRGTPADPYDDPAEPAGQPSSARDFADREPAPPTPWLPKRLSPGPPLPKRIRRASEDWYAAPHQPAADGRSGQAPPLGEADELFRAWQGSVNQAAGRRAPRTARWPDLGRTMRFRRRGWQAAKIGGPAVVIVTVGAGALLLLTGRANGMLAERASSAALSAGKPTSGPVASGQTSAGSSSAAWPASTASSLAVVAHQTKHGTWSPTPVSAGSSASPGQ